MNKKDFKTYSKARYDNQNSGSQNSNLSSNQQAITKVVSLRNIPNDTTDLQMVLIGLQFGEVVNILYIKGKGQALIEFTNLKEANDMINYFHHIPDNHNNSSLKGVEAAHSSYQQLTIDNNRVASTMNTIQLAKQLKDSSLLGGDNHVIKAQFSNIVYPICIDALYQIFSKCGNVLKIILIQKSKRLSFSSILNRNNLV
jgi:polypyrimidine tract-binding protein 1